MSYIVAKYFFPSKTEIFKCLTYRICEPKLSDFDSFDSYYKRKRKYDLQVKISKVISDFFQNLTMNSDFEVQSNVDVAFLEFECFFSPDSQIKIKQRVVTALIVNFQKLIINNY